MHPALNWLIFLKSFFFKVLLPCGLIIWSIISPLENHTIINIIQYLSPIAVLAFWNFVFFMRARKENANAHKFQKMLANFYACLPIELNVKMKLNVIYEISFFNFLDRYTIIAEFDVPKDSILKAWSIYVGSVDVPRGRFLGLEKILKMEVYDITNAAEPKELPFVYYLVERERLYVLVCLSPDKQHHKIKISLIRPNLWKPLRSGKGEDSGTFTVPAVPCDLTLRFKFPDKYPKDKIDLRPKSKMQSEIQKKDGEIKWFLSFQREKSGAVRVIEYSVSCALWKGKLARVKIFFWGLRFLVHSYRMRLMKIMARRNAPEK